MGFCRNWYCFYLEGEETSGKSASVAFASWATGEVPWVDLGIPKEQRVLLYGHARYGSFRDLML